jgi:hypothetical protein
MAVPVDDKRAERSVAHGGRRITQLKFDVLILLAVITLQVFGLIMVYSASYDYSLNWYGNAATVEEVKNACKTKWFRFQGNDVGMTSPDSIPFAMWRWGISGRMGVGDLRLLKYYVSRGRPPIVLLRSSEQTWHYVVVIGYDEQNVVIANPGSGNKETLSNANFQGAWDFTSDMEGQKIQRKFDIYLQLVKLGDVKGQTFIVPFFAR